MTIRSFLYLDEYKLYSFSSQLFSGLTEYVVTGSEEQRAKHDEMKLPTSAKVVADIARETVNRQERRFLHDHAYNLFESELVARDAVTSIVDGADLPDLESPRFVRITGRGRFIDASL